MTQRPYNVGDLVTYTGSGGNYGRLLSVWFSKDGREFWWMESMMSKVPITMTSELLMHYTPPPPTGPPGDFEFPEWEEDDEPIRKSRAPLQMGSRPLDPQSESNPLWQEDGPEGQADRSGSDVPVVPSGVEKEEPW